ncbi:CD97 antigen-like protein [Labeo rohita]|uniref:CD97 antigen-like protein n=1 Tax=Labeo rohita TaxID=84645 RepID=A0A498M412_LABRO|nr:CD97 antigen-like protein [Labeo rohita]
MKAQVDVICCKSVGTDLSMLDIEDFITEICQLKKEVASLEAKLREREEKQNGEDSVWSIRDEPAAQLSDQRSGNTQDSELSLSLLCYTDAQESMCDSHGSVDQTPTESLGSDCNAGEQQTAETQMRVCSIKLVDCRNPKETIEEATAEKEKSDNDDGNCDDDADFNPLDENSSSSSDEETASTSKEQMAVKSFSCVVCGKTFSKQGNLARHERKHTEQKDYSCKKCDISFPTLKERRLHSKEHSVKKEFRCEQCGKVSFSSDIDECSDPDVCGTYGDCYNHPGGYSCKCQNGYSNYGNNQSKCIEMDCDQFEPESGEDQTLEKMKRLMSLLKNSCESLNDPHGEIFTGEKLLESLCSSSDELLSDENIADGKMLSHFLGTMENSMRLIGPQLKKPVTRMEMNNTVAEVAVTRSQTRPSGPVTLSTDSALFNTSWETVVGKSYPGFAFAALVSYKDLNSSSDVFHKMSREKSDDKKKSGTFQLNSKVVTAVVSNAETKQLPEPVMLVFTHVKEGVESEGVAYSCVYWDEAEGAWSGQGCKRAWSNSTHTACSCSHLSSFAVLMALYDVKDTFELVLITRVGLALSLVCLFLCILTFQFCRSIQGTRTSIHLHLSICLFIADLVFLCGISSTENQVGCAIVAGLLHFFFLSAFCWMLLEGVQLYRMVVLVFHTTLKHLYLYLVGYGVPLVIVIISASAYPKGYGTDRQSFTVTAVAQLCILGGGWVFGFFLFQEKVMMYLFTILNSLQGAFIFIMHCLLNKPVRTAYYNLFVRMCPHKKKAEYSTSNSQMWMSVCPQCVEFTAFALTHLEVSSAPVLQGFTNMTMAPAAPVKVWTNIDECSDDPDVCGTNADCKNHPGGYSCKCHKGYSNYGNNQSKCIEMKCDQFEPESDEDQTPEKFKHLMSLLKNSCESLNDPHGDNFTGEKLLENLFSSSDELLSDKNIADGKTLSQFLGTMEKSMRLIGPQLKEPVTRIEMDNTVAEVAVMRNQTPPSGRVTLSTDSALFNTSWEIVVGKSYPGFAFAALVSYKDLNSSSDLFHKMSREKSDDKKKSVTLQLNSKVVTPVVSNTETKQLPEPVMLVFTHMKFCRSIQGTRTSIHLHLSICLFIADLVFLCGISSTQNKVGCAIVAGLLHFFFLSAFCWMLLEGVQLYRMVVLVFHTTLKHLYMYLVGYGVPLVIVIVCASAYPKGYGTDRHCWLSPNFILSFFIPVCIVVILNYFFFIITVWKLAKKFSSLNPDLSILKKIRCDFTVTSVAQLCILGGGWIFGFFLFQEKGTEVIMYLFTILNSLQGAFIFIMHCLLNKPVRIEYYNLFVRMCPHKKKEEYSISDSQVGEEKRIVTSRQITSDTDEFSGDPDADEFSGDPDFFPTEMDCDQFKPRTDADHTPEKLKHLMSQMKNSCESLKDPDRGHVTGQKLLENLCNSTDELLSEGNITDDKTLSHFLNIMENSMHLIGPQLKEPVTRMETHNTFVEVAVTRNQTPPSGRVTLSTDSALFGASWETVVGESYPGFAFAALVSYKDLNSSGDFLQKMSREKSDDNDTRSVTFQLNSKVVTAIVSNTETKQLSEPVMLVFTHVEERAESAEVAYSCVYWDVAEGAWSGRGCERAWSNSTHTVCYWSHFSTFAVLMALYPVQDTFELVLITRVGLALSLVCLFLCILTFQFCRSIQGTRTSIHLHLSICLFIADLVFLFGISSTQNKVGCAIVAGLLHFFFLSAFCWMLLEGVQLYRMVVLVFHTTLKHLYMYLVGYGVPLVIVIISASAYPKGYGTDRHCWLSLDHYFILSFFIPVCIIGILNCFFFIITVWKLATKFSSLNPDLSKLKQIRSGRSVTIFFPECARRKPNTEPVPARPATVRNLYGVTTAQQSHRCKAIVVSRKILYKLSNTRYIKTFCDK